jgi:putative protease
MATEDNKVELLAPAGNLEKLEIAIHYGADAVYLAGKDFSLRNFSGNFTPDELQQAVSIARTRGVKTYVACNVYARNDEQAAIRDYLGRLGEIGPDALIVADPGIITEARRIVPHIPLHLSTQANTTNVMSAAFWQRQGIRRINTARELTLKEIAQIARLGSVEIEVFVHGAMCISYSGRCLLSSFMANRDSNRGLCTQPCRWNYSVVEETRPGQYMPVYEDRRGSYIFNSRDLCMIEHIPQLVQAGVAALKIEGRMKGINYVASTVKVYRAAIDAYSRDPKHFGIDPDWRMELNKISHRGYCTGFYLGHPDQTAPNFQQSNSACAYVFIGKVVADSVGNQAKVDVRNKIFEGEAVEVLTRSGPSKNDRIRTITDDSGNRLACAQPGSTVMVALESRYRANDLIRRLGGG